MIADLSGHQEVRENLLLAVMLVPAVTLLVQVQIQDHLVESGLLKDLLVTTEVLEENGLIQDQLVMSEHLVESGLLRDQLVMIVHQDANGLLRDHNAMTVHHVVMTELLAESGHQNALSVMTEHLVVNGLQKDQLVTIVLQEENGLIQDQLVMTEVLEKLQSVDQADAVISAEWEEMGLHPRLLETLVQMGAISPFPIQQATIPAAISGRDILGRGKTGSGKTIAFAVPLITKLVAQGSQPRKPNRPRALILAPTRELADQIDRTLSQLARSVGFYTTCIYGGMPQRRQEIAMARGVDILVATPGRLEDLMAQKIVDLRDVETLVIDEADHMCDLGFIEPVKRITAATGDSQKMLFSATLDREIDALVKQFLPNPYVYEVPNETEETSDIVHRVMFAETDARSPILLRLVQGEGKAIIFTRTKMTAERLSESLTSAGVPAARLHGDLNQNQRNRNLQRFMSGEVRVLVATDVAARGIHVDDIAMVIQVDPPEEYKTYLHRSGRTGRAGKQGTVITLVPRSRRRKVEDLLRRAERDAIYMDVRQDSPILAEIAGPIAPAPAVSNLDFGDSRGGSSREGGRGRSDRGGSRGGSRDFGGRSDRGGSRGGSRDGARSGGRPAGKFAGKSGGRPARDR
jgi:superfamily II DNA/RNA helicase